MRFVRRFVLPVLLLVAGVVIAQALIAAKPTAAHHEVEVPITYVDVVAVEREDHRARIKAMGVVRAEREVVLQPEVGGRVIEIHAQLVAGGRIAKGESLLKVDPRDYSAQVAAVQAELSQASLALREEATLRRVAEHEWQGRTDVSQETLDFAMRAPHLDAANARISSVQTRIDKARRDLKRTSLRAPFDAIVVDESIDIGQMVGPQTPVARLAGTERFWVQLSVPVDDLAMVEVPGVNIDAARGSPARVVHHTSSRESSAHDGYAVRLAASVEERGRMAQLFVVVEDPLGLRRPIAERGMPLLIGRYVEVELEGKMLEGVIAVPRAALIDDTRLWIVDDQGRLRARTIEVVWREDAQVWTRTGLESGDRVVARALPTATDGMFVTIAADEPPPAPAKD